MDTASTVIKALDTLTVLSGTSSGISLPELAQALNQPRTNVVRLLGSLQSYGLVKRDGRNWKVTRAFHEWSAPPDRYAALRKLYRPMIEEIANGTNELVLIGLHEGNGCVHIDFVESDHRVRVAPSPATRHSLRHNAMGKLALSRRLDLAANFEDDADFQKELEEIRDTGVAWNKEETVRGVITMAVPGFTNQPTEPIIVVAWPVQRFTDELAEKALLIVESARSHARSSKK